MALLVGLLKSDKIFRPNNEQINLNVLIPTLHYGYNCIFKLDMSASVQIILF